MRSKSAASRPAIGQTCLLLVVSALLGVCCSGPPAQAGAIVALRFDGGLVDLRWENATDGVPVVDREHAVAAARAGLASPSDVADAHLVRLTGQTRDSGELALDRGKVWLVTFPDVAFAAGEACACDGSPTRLKTIVAVDATDGTVLASFGAD